MAAVILYSEAFTCSPKNLFLIKRCECLMEMKSYQLALDDALKVIENDRNDRLPYYKAMDCLLLLGEVEEMEKIVAKFRTIAPKINLIETNQVQKLKTLITLTDEFISFVETKDYAKCLECVDKILTITPASPDFLFKKLRCLIALERFEEAKQINAQLCSLTQPLMFMEAIKLYYQGNLSESLKMLTQVSSALPKKIKAVNALESVIFELLNGISQGKSATKIVTLMTL